MKQGVLNSVTSTAMTSILFLLLSIFDRGFLLLAVYVWCLLPILLIIDLIFYLIKLLVKKL